MKIIFYYYMGGGGGLANMLLLLRAMARRYPATTIEFVTSSRTPVEAVQDVPNIAIRRLRVTGIREVDRLLVGAFLLRRIVRETNADVVWSLNIGPYFRTGTPAVLSINNAFQVYPWEVSRYYPGKPWHLAVLRWFFRRSLRTSDALIVQTSIMEEVVRQIPGCPSRRFVGPKAVEQETDVSPESLPESLQAVLDMGIGREAFTFLYVSSWKPHKNHKTLVEAFTELSRRKIPTRVVLTVRPEEFLSSRWRNAAHLIESGHIVTVGWVAKRYLKALYEACDACLMPSLLESLSSAHIEAMQWGRPQVTADLPYARAVCGPAALYAEAEDAMVWVKQIERVIGDEELRQALVGAGHVQMEQFPKSLDEAAATVQSFLEAMSRES